MADRDVLELANDEEFGDGGMDDMENEVPEHKLFFHAFSNMGWMTMRCLTDKFFFSCTNSQVEDEVVSKLKDKAKRRKGRGFTGGRGEDRDEVNCLAKSRDRRWCP